MKTKLLAMVLMAGSTMFAGVRFGVGVGFAAPAPVVVAAAPCPPPFVGAYWVAPHYIGRHYYAGYWGHRHEVYGRGFRR
jgi:hypothetical protein